MASSMRDVMNPNLATERDPDFPHAPDDWSRANAESVASSEGLEMSADHWAAVVALQEYMSKTDEPNARELHDALDERFHTNGGLKYLYKLFPGGPVAQGCRVAGLEAPAGASDSSFGSVQ